MSVHLTRSPDETEALGEGLGEQLAPGDVVLLSGGLGAGKTVFVRGLARGLGCDPDEVSSPTFTLIQEYTGRATLQHVDLYRLSAVEVEELALDELMAGAVLAVEWPDRWRVPPEGARTVTFETTAEGRRIHVGKPGSPTGG